MQREAFRIDVSRLRAANASLAHERVAPVTEDERVLLDAREALALLLQGVLDLEQVGEVGIGVEAEFELDRLGVVIQDSDVLVEAVADRAVAMDGHRWVLVDRSRRRDEEMFRREVLRLVSREHLERRAVRRQMPEREEASVAVEEAVRLVGRCVDVAAQVADEEGRAVEDADRVLCHVPAPWVAA